MKELKLLFLTNNINQIGGLERVIAILSNYFAEKENQKITILSLYTKRNCLAFDFSNKVEIVHGNLNLKDDIKPYLRDTLSSNTHNIIFTFNTDLGLEFLRIRKHFPELIWIATEHISPFDYTWKRRALNLLVYAGADRLIVLTEYARKYYRNRFIYHTHTIPNALSFITDKKSDVLLHKRIIAIGRIEKVKCFDLLIEAFSLIAQKNADWKLELVGDGSQKTILQENVLELGLEDQIYFSGYRKDVKELCLEASFCVITSKYEGFSMIALEALECGLPLISFDLPSIKEIVGDYKAALFVPQGKIDELAQKMQWLMDNPEELQYMANEAKKCAKNYHISKIGKKWDDLLDELNCY